MTTTAISLTAMEKQLLCRLREGLTIQELANELHYSPNGLRTRLSVIYAKLGVNNAHGAVIEAIREQHIPLFGSAA